MSAESTVSPANGLCRYAYDETIGVMGVRIPFVQDIITPKIERPMRNNRYEKGECLAVRELVRAGDRVLELGAGLGLVSAIAAQVEGVEKVVSVEANPDLIDLIRETHRINDISGIDLRNGVVAPVSCPAQDFYLRADFWASSMEPDSRPYVSVASVPGLGLDSLLEEVQPTVLIADIEGAELELFDATRLEGVRTAILELHPKVYGEDGQAHIISVFEKMGFRVHPNYLKGSVWVFEREDQMERPAAVAPVQMPSPEHKLDNPEVTIITCMKNEGPFILEWIAFHKSIGIHNFVIFTNHCTDGTDLLLDRLDEMGIVTHLPNPAVMMEKTYFQPIAFKYGLTMPVVRRSDYIISMDVDEFINIRAGQGHFTDLLKAAGPFHALSMSELNFSSGGHETYEDCWLTESFTSHETPTPGRWKARRGVKTILNGLTAFERPANHRPIIRPGTQDQLIWKDGSGRPMDAEFVGDQDHKSHDSRGTYDLVALNHHALRSVDSYLIKMDRGDVVAAWRKVNQKYYRVRSRDGHEEGWINHQLPAARETHAELMQDAELARLHDLCVARHKARLEEIRDNPETRELRDWITENYFS